MHPALSVSMYYDGNVRDPTVERYIGAATACLMQRTGFIAYIYRTDTYSLGFTIWRARWVDWRQDKRGRITSREHELSEAKRARIQTAFDRLKKRGKLIEVIASDDGEAVVRLGGLQWI